MKAPQRDGKVLRAWTAENDRGREDPSLENEADDQLWHPTTVALRLFDQEEVTRTKIVWLTYGLLGCVVLGGLVALVAVSALGGTAEPALDYLKSVTTAAFALTTFAVGYYFGRHPRGGGADN